MTEQRRTWRVLMCLAAAMTAGAVALMSLEGGPVSGGAFSLASYTSLNSVENVINTKPRSVRHWRGVEICYTGSLSGHTGRLAELIGAELSPEAGFHFLISDGRDGRDGFIISTDNWQKQLLNDREESVNSPVGIIRIGVITQNGADGCTDCQRQRTANLVERLSRRFNIAAEHIRYPADWQL